MENWLDKNCITEVVSFTRGGYGVGLPIAVFFWLPVLQSRSPSVWWLKVSIFTKFILSTYRDLSIVVSVFAHVSSYVLGYLFGCRKLNGCALYLLDLFGGVWSSLKS